RVKKQYGDDQAFLATEGARQRLLWIELKRVDALIAMGDLSEADQVVERLLKENAHTVEVLTSKGLLLEAKAAAKKGKWAAAFQHWQSLAQRLSLERPKRPACYDAWYHTALALYKDGKPAEAKKTLAGIMRLSPAVGSPEIKARYVALLGQIK